MFLGSVALFFGFEERDIAHVALETLGSQRFRAFHK
jgi:hypothetical protein